MSTNAFCETGQNIIFWDSDIVYYTNVKNNLQKKFRCYDNNFVVLFEVMKLQDRPFSYLNSLLKIEEHFKNYYKK